MNIPGARACAILALVFVFGVAGAPAKSLPKQSISGSDGSQIELARSTDGLTIEYKLPRLGEKGTTVYLAFNTHHAIGSAILPFVRECEGSTVILPFKADRLFAVQVDPSARGKIRVFERRWDHWRWSDRRETNDPALVEFGDGRLTFRIANDILSEGSRVDLALYAKDLAQNGGWGELFGCSDAGVSSGTGDKYIAHSLSLDLKKGDPIAEPRSRLANSERIRIYQLFVRMFGNTNEKRKENGTLVENGVGKFAHINDSALTSIREMGFTHVWLTGVLQQATATDYSPIGQPADDPDLLKGLAGSPYAIKDYFDVCPDYANDPAKRIEEFRSLLARIHQQKMKAMIDFVPNHVARSYGSDVQPENDFGSKGNGGKGDDTSLFFDPNNNFFYLPPESPGPPLRLPTCRDGQPLSPTCKAIAVLKQGAATSQSPNPETSAAGKPPLLACDGLYEPEKEHGRVTGNNKASWTPDLGDWYETVKLNYGYDFTGRATERRLYPNASAPDRPIPDTWHKMDAVIAYWQKLGVDGFRCDMSHMIPPEFWNWAIDRARNRNPDVVFIGEAYDNDPAKVPSSDPFISQLAGGKSNVMFDLLNAGFNGVYDDPTYRAIKKIYEGPGWANDIDSALPDHFIFDNSLRYAENHDEVRLSAKAQWGGIGMNVGIPVSAILYGLSRGPLLLYNGQEVGEPGAGVEGFGGDDSRTSIFDYWSMPEMVKWVNNHRYDGGGLSEEQKRLRYMYGRLVKTSGEPAFRDGSFIPLNQANRDNPNFGRIGNESPSGHWLYAFLRYDRKSSQRFLVVINLHPKTLMPEVSVKFSREILAKAGLDGMVPASHINMIDRLVENEASAGGGTIAESIEKGLGVDEMPPLTARYFELTVEDAKAP